VCDCGGNSTKLPPTYVARTKEIYKLGYECCLKFRVFSGGPTKFYWDWGLCVVHCSPRTPLSAPAQLLGTPSNCIYAHKPWLPFDQVLFVGYISLINMHLDKQLGQEALQCTHICLHSPDTGVQRKWKEPRPKKVSMTAQPASNKCYKIYFRGPRVFKRWAGNILKCKLAFPPGGTEQHTSAEDNRTCHN
jgi:hypothetical protein